MRKPTGYTLYIKKYRDQTHVSGEKFSLSDASKAWKELSDEEKAHYQQQAKALPLPN